MRIPPAIAPVLIGCLFMATLGDVQAPSSQELQRLYSEPTMERYTVRPGITLTVEYGSDRLACQLLVERTGLLEEMKNQGPPISSRSVTEILQEVVPVATRGKEIDSTVVQAEDNKLVKTEYENVSIQRICSVQSCVSSSENQDVATVVIFKRAICSRHVAQP